MKTEIRIIEEDDWKTPTDEAREEGRRDDNFARRLAKPYPDGIGDQVRYDHRTKRWLIWDGVRWAPDTKREIHNLLRARLKDWLIAAADFKNELKDLATLGDIRKQESVLEALSTMPPVQSAGTEYDENPNLLGVLNGTVDLTTGTLKKSEQTDLITMSTSVAFNPDATCPKFDAFMKQITGNNETTEEYLWLILGAALFGHTNPQQFWVFKGQGSNGKGVLSNVVGNILGDYSCTPSRLLYMNTAMGEANSSAPRSDLVALYKKRFAHMSEPNAKKGASFNEELLKEHTGQDVIHARDLHMRSTDAIDFIPSHSIFFRTNLTPKIENMNIAMIRRLRIIPFRQQFADNPDGFLTATLTAEGEGILAKLVTYAATYHADPSLINKLPREVSEETSEYIEDNDPFSGFIEDECVIEAGGTLPFADAWAAYEAWVEAQKRTDPSIFPESQKALGSRLGNGFNKLKRRPVVYKGIRLKETPSQQALDEKEGVEEQHPATSTQRGYQGNKFWLEDSDSD